MLRYTLKVSNKLGMHARPAAALAQLANKYASDISIVKIGGEEEAANVKSLLSVLMLAASNGTVLELRVDGCDEEEAMQALLGLFESKFGEEDV